VLLGVAVSRSKMSGRTMSYEFDSLDATERAALKGALIRCREHFFDELTLADFCASLERAADILGKKGR
jgi:hypothetical protein